MSDPERDTGYWMGWALACALVGCCLLFALFDNDRAVKILCSEDDQNCGREWIMALAGWAAIPAAVLLLLQIKSADQHHRDIMDIQLARSRALAHRARKEAKSLIAVADTTEMFWRTGLTRDDEKLDTSYEEEVKDLTELLASQVFQRFEDEVFLPEVSAVETARKLSLDRVNILGPNTVEDSVEDMRLACQSAHRYGVEVIKAVEEFERKVAKLTGSARR